MKYPLFLTLVFVLSNGGAATAFAENGHGASQVVKLSRAEQEEFGVEVATAGPGVVETHLELPGEVRPNADRLAHIVPRYSGIVTEIRANIGDHVKKGQVLAIIESDESLAPFAVKTLIAGTVIAKHVALGEAISRDRDTFVIADLSTVWIDMIVYQRDLSRVKIGEQVEVYVGHEPVRDTGIISYVTPVVDERTRTATARLVLANEKGVWKPGMFITAKVLVDKMDVPLAVPPSALQSIAGNDIVFLEKDEVFETRAVVLGRSSTTSVEILAGLSAGDRYVSAGGFILKAELGKEVLGDEHGH